MMVLFDWQLDVAIDGADDVDSDLNAIKGGGYARIHCFSNFILVIRDAQVLAKLGW